MANSYMSITDYISVNKKTDPLVKLLKEDDIQLLYQRRVNQLPDIHWINKQIN
jgi:hypothetical protein